jgi:hypothetical protein
VEKPHFPLVGAGFGGFSIAADGRFLKLPTEGAKAMFWKSVHSAQILIHWEELSEDSHCIQLIIDCDFKKFYAWLTRPIHPYEFQPILSGWTVPLT